MKRAIALFIVAVLSLSLCACNIDLSAQVESISDSLFNQIVDVGGGVLKEDTSSDDKYNYDDELLESDTNTSTETETLPSEPENPDVPDEPNPDDPNQPIEPDVPDDPDEPDEPNPDEPDEPEEPEEPEEPSGPVLVPYERPNFPLNKIPGINLTAKNHKDSNGIFGSVRLNRTFENLNTDSLPYGYFTINGMSTLAHLDTDLSTVNVNDVEYLKLYSKALSKFVGSYGGGVYNVRYIEIGSDPASSISAQDYAKLLNYCYDGNMSELGEGYGIAEKDSSVKLIVGQIKDLNIAYVRDLMTAISEQRTDGFMPIGGWSFEYVPSKSPEKAFLNNMFLDSIIDYRNTFYPNMEIQISSFGWDNIYSSNTNYAGATDDYTSEEMQMAYYLRSYMILDAVGVDRVTNSTLYDTESDGSGVLTQDGTKKVAFDAIKTFKKITKNMQLKETVVNGENGVYVYLYETETGSQLYAMWSTDGATTYQIGELEGGTLSKTSYDKESGKYVTSSDALEMDIAIDAVPTFISNAK